MKRIIILLVSLFFVGCYHMAGEEKKEVARVLTTSPGDYEFYIPVPGGSELQQVVYKTYCGDNHTGEPRIFVDVAPESKMWIKLTRFKNGADECFTLNEIHLHRPAEIEGGTWTETTNPGFAGGIGKEVTPRNTVPLE